MLDIRQSPQYAKYLSRVGWIIERKNGVNYFIKKLPFWGAIIKIQRTQKIDFKEIEKLKRKYHAFQIVIESEVLTAPTTSFAKPDHNLFLTHGFKLSKSPYLPTKTIHLDLEKTEKEILLGFKKDCRHIVQRVKKQIYLHNISKFRSAWRKSVGFKRFVPPLSHLLALKQAFDNKCLFLLSSDGSSGAIFLRTGKIAYYWQAFTNKQGRKVKAQYNIVWEGIRWAKQNGCEVFDFEGIFDSRFPNKSWLGFSHFKKSFGGREVEYPGCFVKNVLFG